MITKLEENKQTMKNVHRNYSINNKSNTKVLVVMVLTKHP